MAFQRLTAGAEPAEPLRPTWHFAPQQHQQPRKATHDRKYAQAVSKVMQLQFFSKVQGMNRKVAIH